ncbi:hypothetical protein QFW77_03325 [Luteimonas sp. RD2P54]|uniref:Uncharacterized protein n=1 Tax=Luteimonas endophytica TaxID=3042023 RepID=A0ABT6J5C8_9GAMM|nr:hypothetical protein [Luteimonas endophytica]MDH5822026.1 hypothetical protein [Luteimonas endophytica]
MPLQALLAEVHPSWYAADGEPAPAPALLGAALRSRLGRRMLARALLASGTGQALLAPRPGSGLPTAVARWPRERLARLVRDLGVLAYAPVIRAEVRREPVRRLRRTLGNSYLLALDPTVWDAAVGRAVLARLAADWERALVEDDDALFAMLERQGRGELRAWAAIRDPALGDWTALLHERSEVGPAHLPEKPVLLLCTHHESRAAAAA